MGGGEGFEDGGYEYMRGKDRTISSARASIKGLIREVAKKKLGRETDGDKRGEQKAIRL